MGLRQLEAVNLLKTAGLGEIEVTSDADETQLAVKSLGLNLWLEDGRVTSAAWSEVVDESTAV